MCPSHNLQPLLPFRAPEKPLLWAYALATAPIELKGIENVAYTYRHRQPNCLCV